MNTAKTTRVAKLGGAACLQPDTLAALGQAWRRDGGRWVVVHGGGPQLDRALEELDGEPVKLEGLRVTSAPAATRAAEVLDQVGAQITAALLSQNVPARHILAQSKALRADLKLHPRGDLGRVGTPASVALDALGDGDGVAVVGPMGWDELGLLNVNADEAALAIARALGAECLHLVTDVAKVRDAAGAPVDTLDAEGAQAFIDSGAAQGGMVPKLRAALGALEHGVREVMVGDLHAGTRIVPVARR